MSKRPRTTSKYPTLPPNPDRARRLKGIKADAEEELAEYKDVQKRKFEQALRDKKAELDAMDNAGESSNAAGQMAALETDFNAQKGEVIKMLIGNVMNVNIEIPRVVKGDFDE